MVAQATNLRAKGAAGKRTAASLVALRYDDILESRVCFGTAARIVDRLREWQELLEIDGIIIETNAGNMVSEERELNSLRIITHEVMPAFK
jgi:alkanesulfonate monooxygenase SsuD/methylene tetrahydromethanopterin reductase-like flavin-dependent oxidoreductase (luciferase family)